MKHTLLLALLFALPAQAQSIRVVDGDTVDAGYSENVRLTLDQGGSFDTPETWRPGCAYERQLGELATQRLRQLLRQGNVSLAILPGTCGHGRLCGALSVDGVNVGEILIAEGLARPVRNYDWCG